MPFELDHNHQSINPYTFIPPRTDSAYLKGDTPSSAWFHKDRYSVRITCDITFLTHALIPGPRRTATRELEGMLWAYKHNDRLAIPGSRLRGQFLHLMRLINGSPMRPEQYADTPILERRPENPRCGIIKEYNQETGKIRITEIVGKTVTCYSRNGEEIPGQQREILVAGSDRNGEFNLQQSATLQSCPRDGDIFIFDPKTKTTIKVPELNPSLPYDKQGVNGEADWEHPAWGPPGTRPHKMYMAMPETGMASEGRWVKIPAWSGQDGENCLKDTTSNRDKTHYVVWHLVDLDTLSSEEHEFDVDVENFKTTAKVLADAAKEDSDKRAHAENIRSMKDWLKPGTFVYFIFNEEEKSFGLHFQYFRYPARVHPSASPAGDAPKHDACIVDGIQGAANDSDQSGRRSRFWAEMALAEDNAPATQEVNLRILSSQPPKAACFYLKPSGNGRPATWGEGGSQLRGRKVYWHDPKYNRPLWDDIGHRTHFAFENPYPGNPKLKSQWSRAELVQPNTRYTVTLRCLNFSKDELFLLLTALVGFNPQDAEGRIVPGGTAENPDWCHKIGGARAFMGSARLGITSIERLSFDTKTLAPVMDTDGDITPNSLKKWQADTLKESEAKHLESLKRVMRYHGAYEKDDPGLTKSNIRIAWPLGQNNSRPVLDFSDPNRLPAVFNWFSFNKDRQNNRAKVLPFPLKDAAQALSAWVKTPDQRQGPQQDRRR
ncbi:MAG: hypothetical protein BWY09_00609 [Candidatus Hydrogenedentes bacterium ADurb.Bin179]|nr:MAG: hypothetical protein BWY09_00609 [Candidatus Hydrogenedentes bacterium ADurb.Bin179]